MRDYVSEALARAAVSANSSATPDGGTAGVIPLLATVPRAAASQANGDHWPMMDKAAYHGVVGDVVRAIEPHSEADPVAILLQLLVVAGNVVGRSPHYRVEADDHHANLFVVLVGQSAKGRKGTSAGRVRSIMEAADERGISERMKGGLSSGEGLISEVRDEIKRWNSQAQQYETVDPGVTDKRLIITEAEFGNALAVMERPGNNLSSTIRNAWDGHTLSTLTKNSPLKASNRRPYFNHCAHY